MARENVLYISIMPIIHLSVNFGLTEQILTLFPDRNFATEFLPEHVAGVLATFESRAKDHLSDNNISYTVHPENTGDGRVIVKVIQHVK